MTVAMRDGSEVTDVRLGRLRDWDERNEAWLLAASPAYDPSKPPRSYTWPLPERHWQVGGSCVAFSGANEAAGWPIAVKGLTVPQILDWYYRMQDIDPWPGSARPGDSPRYEGTSALAGAKVMRELGYIAEYRWVLAVEELVWWVGRRGPVLLATDWTRDMFYPDAEGIIRPGGPVDGGHQYMVRGVSLKRGLLAIPNTWKGWGRNGSGDCYLPIEDAARLLAEDGECWVPIGRRRP